MDEQAGKHPFRRRHELALVVLFVLLAILAGFWFGRVTAPDSYLAYERGRVDGRDLERRHHEQTRMELDILRGEAEAAKTSDSSRNTTADAKTKPDQAPGVGTK